MLAFGGNQKVFLYGKACDMRKVLTGFGAWFWTEWTLTLDVDIGLFS
jgi:hypothetical protein